MFLKRKISWVILLGIFFLGSVCYEVSTLASESKQINECLYIVSEDTIDMSYDDRYEVANNYKDYVVVKISNDSIKSYKVDKGKKTSNLDEQVVRLEEKSNVKLIASAIGSAEVYLAKKDVADKASKCFDKDYVKSLSRKEKKDTIELIKLNVDVKPARLTTMFISGQSNAEGICSANTGFHPEDSILCDEGTVYTAYTNHAITRGDDSIVGIKDMVKIPTEESNKAVPSSLVSSQNIFGEELQYKPNALTCKGLGKTGFDSGLAYEWNRKTGDKVFVVNAAWSGSSIKAWQQGQNPYKNAYKMFKSANELVNAEIEAKHYEMGNKYMFWLQGEADSNMQAEEYLKLLLEMHNTFKVELGYEKIGIIMVRAAGGNHNNEMDLKMTSPRIVQNYLASSANYADIYVVSTANEEWTSDEGVRKYFSAKYEDGKLSYPLRKNATIKDIPTSVAQVHEDIHYAQVGHNENGLSSADEMLAIANSENTDSISGQFKNANGQTVSSIIMNKSSKEILVPTVKTLSQSKNVNFTLQGNAITWDAVTGELKSNDRPGIAILTMVNGITNKEVAKCSIIVRTDTKPKLKNVANQNDGINIEWEQIVGVDNYAVFRKEDGGKWQSIDVVNGNIYIDLQAQIGKKYSYSVRGIDPTSNEYLTDFDQKGVQIERKIE